MPKSRTKQAQAAKIPEVNEQIIPTDLDADLRDKEEIASKPIRIKPKNSVPIRIREKPSIEAKPTGKYLLTNQTAEADEICEGPGSKTGWAHLTNGDGWVGLDFVEKVE